MQSSGGTFIGKTHVLLILGLVLLVRLPDLPYHYVNWDEGTMMSQAWAMTRGERLYKDIYQIHPLFNIAILYPFFSLLSPEIAPHAIKLMNLLLVGAGGILVYRIAASWFGRGVPSLLSAMVFVFYLGRQWALSSFGRFYALFPILLSVYFMFGRRHGSRRTYILCGLLWATAVFLIQVAILDVIALYLFLLLFRRESPPRRLEASLYLALGGLAVVAGVSLYLLGRGILHDSIQWAFLRPLAGYAQLSPSSQTPGAGAPRGRIELLRLVFANVGPTFFLPLLGMACGTFRAAQGWRKETSAEGSRGRSFFTLCLIWVGTDLLGILLMGRFYYHYMLLLVPGISLACVYWVAGLDRGSMLFLGGALLTMIVAVSGYQLLQKFHQDGAEPFKVRRSRAIASYIAANTRKDDRIFLYRFGGSDVFFLSGRLSNNGIYQYVDMCEDHMKDPQLAAAKREEFKRNPPEAIVVDPLVGPAGCESSDDFFEKVIGEEYTLSKVIYGSDVYLRRSDKP